MTLPPQLECISVPALGTRADWPAKKQMRYLILAALVRHCRNQHLYLRKDVTVASEAVDEAFCGLRNPEWAPVAAALIAANHSLATLFRVELNLGFLISPLIAAIRCHDFSASSQSCRSPATGRVGVYHCCD